MKRAKRRVEKRAPAGFRFSRGLDGLLIGLTVVFLVRVEMALESLLNWELLPAWARQPIMTHIEGALGSLLRAVAGRVRPSAAGSSLEALEAILPVVADIIGIPVFLAGGLSGSVLEQALITVGGWVAILAPLWYWVISPVLFGWRDE